MKGSNFLTSSSNKAISFVASGYLYIGKFPIYDTNITVDISCTTSTTYSGKLVIACQNYKIMKASVFGDYSNMVTANTVLKLIDNTVEIYFKPQAWSKNLIHIAGCGIQGAVTHVCEKISTIPTDATSQPINEFEERIIPLRQYQLILDTTTISLNGIANFENNLALGDTIEYIIDDDQVFRKTIRLSSTSDWLETINGSHCTPVLQQNIVSFKTFLFRIYNNHIQCYWSHEKGYNTSSGFSPSYDRDTSTSIKIYKIIEQ